MDARFDPSDAILGVDFDSGDAIVYCGGAAASFCEGTWHPGRVFNWTNLVSRDSRFSAVDDPAEVQRYLDAARDALVQSLAITEEGAGVELVNPWE